MKLEPDIKRHLEQLDAEKGGGLNPESIKINTISNPIFIIGLGGTGVEALIRTKRQINRTFISEKSEDGTFKDKPSNIEYLAIDTDDNNQRINFENTTFSKEHNEFLLFENSKLTSIYKNRHTVASETTKNWLSDNMRLQQVKHGAGGIRQAGRLMLFINFRSIYNTINDKIQKLAQNKNTDSTIYVFIMAGVSGGTGSGTFIDIPYIVRHIAESKGFKTENIAMIFLPDVTLAQNSIDGVAATNVKANGFAALKELDYLMNLEKNGESFVQNYGDIVINTNEHPFDMCHLISSLDANGKIIVNAKENCMNASAETIINYIASEEITTGQNYTITSYLSNIENNKTAFINSLTKKIPVNYTYNVIGLSATELPVKKLTNYFASQVFKELDKLYDNKVTTDDINYTIQKLEIGLSSLDFQIESKKPAPRSLTSYTYEVLEEKDNIIEEILKLELEKYKEYLDITRDDIINQFSEIIEKKQNVLTDFYWDLEKGPFFLENLISFSQDLSVISTLRQIRKVELAGNIISDEEIDNLEMKKDIELEKIIGKKGKLGILLNKNKQLEKYKSCAKNYLDALMENEKNKTLSAIYEDIEKILEKYHYEVVDTLKELLLCLKEQMDKHSDLRLYDLQQNGIVWDVVNAHELIDTVKSIMKTEPTMNVNTKEIMKGFLKEQIKNSDEWLNFANVQIVQKITSFISNEFEHILNKSLDFYFERLAINRGMDIQKFAIDKVAELKECSKVMFPFSNAIAGIGVEFPPYIYTAIPVNAPKLRNIAGNAVNGNIKYSKMRNTIYMLNLKIAVPLFSYRELNNYEIEYEKSLSRSPGLHLYETEETNWKELNSPNYDEVWLNDYVNRRELEKNNEIRNAFDKALEIGLIKWDSKKDLFVCKYSNSSKIYNAISSYKNKLSQKGLSIAEAHQISHELNELLNDENRFTESAYLYESVFTENGEVDVNYAKGILIQMPFLSRKIRDEVMIDEHIKSLMQMLHFIDEKEKQYNKFARIIYMSEIYKLRRSFQYIGSDNEVKILHTIEDSLDNYIEFELFESFLKLDNSEIEDLGKRAIEKEAKCTNDEITQLVNYIDLEIAKYSSKYEELKVSFRQTYKGDEKLNFYKTMVEVFTKEKELLR